MPATLETVYTPEEMSAYEEGRKAQREGKDYFDSPYMLHSPRNLPELCAFSQGWLDEKDGIAPEETAAALTNGERV
jgi:hypothetical protein